MTFFAQLKKRRVIRATLIYVALLWAVLQAADLLANADLISEQLVRWLILLGVAGLPITMLASWFFETPWRQRKWIAVAGDLAIIVAITLAAALFAWQQWFTAFTRPTVAVLRIEATDTREDSEDLAIHLGLRFRTALATLPELRVIELSSSQHAQLERQSTTDRATLLGADLLLSGTVAQSGSQIRLNIQLFSSDGTLIHGETYEDRLLDQAQIQNRVLNDLWPNLPLPESGLAETRNLIAQCEYPDDGGALLAIAAVDNGVNDVDLDDYLESFPDSGMLQLANSRRLFSELVDAAAVRKPILQPVAMQSLAKARQLCPGMPDAELLRLKHTRETVDDSILLRHPSAALLYRRASEQSSEPQRADAFLSEARLLDPFGDW